MFHQVRSLKKGIQGQNCRVTPKRIKTRKKMACDRKIVVRNPRHGEFQAM